MGKGTKGDCLQVRLLSYAIDAKANMRGVSPCHHTGLRVPAQPWAPQPPRLISPPQPAQAAPTPGTGEATQDQHNLKTLVFLPLAVVLDP